MSADKNHEQYLEQIETAVANTTMDILEKHSGDLRAMAKLVAEKQVEINRLKEYYNDDKKTIRSLRVKLNEAVEEIECRNSTWETKEKEYEEELDIAHFEYDKLKEEKYSLYLKWSELKEELQSSTIAEVRSARDKALAENKKLKEENDKLKEEIELQKDYIDALPENLKEKEYYLEQAYLDLHAVESGNEKLKEEIKELKRGDKRKLKKKVEELEKEIEGLNEYTSDYDTEVEMRWKAEKELEELKEQNEILNKLKEASISQVNSHLEQIVELKKENKKLARGLADQTLKVCQYKIKEEPDLGGFMNFDKYSDGDIEKAFGVSKEVANQLLKDSVIDPKDYE